MPKPEIRYTTGPEELFLGDMLLKRADLDVNAAEPAKSLNGWRETTDEMAAQALLPARVTEYGFEARNYTSPVDAAVQTSASAAPGTPARTTRNKAGDAGAQE